MKRYTEPDCDVMALDIGSVICGSQDAGFDTVNQTEIFEIDDFEFLL